MCMYWKRKAQRGPTDINCTIQSTNQEIERKNSSLLIHSRPVLWNKEIIQWNQFLLNAFFPFINFFSCYSLKTFHNDNNAKQKRPTWRILTLSALPGFKKPTSTTLSNNKIQFPSKTRNVLLTIHAGDGSYP